MSTISVKSNAITRGAAAAQMKKKKKNLPHIPCRRRHCLAITIGQKNVMSSAIGYSACQTILNPENYLFLSISILVWRCTVMYIATLQRKNECLQVILITKALVFLNIYIFKSGVLLVITFAIVFHSIKKDVLRIKYIFFSCSPK